MTPQEKSIEKEIEGEPEDGEISDDDDDAPMELPTNQPNLLINYPSSDDEEKSPEDVINAYKRKIEEEKTKTEPTEPEVVDPKLCKVCLKVEFKYRCPRCDLRTCSLDCSKRHKAENDCDGVRQPFVKVDKLSQYDSQKSIEDQKFMHVMKEKVGLGADQTTASGNEVNQSDGEEKPFDPNALRYNTNSATERYLLNAARFRHVWLGFTNEAGNESRHEQHSDTLFWNLKLTFKKQTEDGGVEVFEKTVANIPETIRIATVLKQFFKPRQYGCIVSESDLDVEKLKPFIERGIEDVNVYMEVHGNPDRFYGVLPDNTILEMTRNRVVADYPKFVITLKDEFIEGMQLLAPEELEQIQTKYGGVGNERFGGGGGGRGRGGRGFHRGGGGRGGGGGPNHHNNFRKRQSNGGSNDGGFKRGRGGNFNGGNRRGGYQNRNNQHNDSFDPFEPFSGPNRLPMEYN
ncbi:hypothetical protein GCK72_017592 [Caenorhabditis remanei]|nr:hypothetical protein GCK72_017592 [Caenorhabditis remanei]KAF1751040.1 hypothetical protein GCK72_017592 [Caenorhabditis remanei]